MLLRYQMVEGFEVNVVDHEPYKGLVRLTLAGAAFGNERRQREFTLTLENVDRLLGGHVVECGVVVKLRLEQLTTQAQEITRDCLSVEETGQRFLYCFDQFLYGMMEDALTFTLPLLDHRSTI